MIRRYSELIKYDTFEERYRYLKLDGSVGVETFGWDRYLNQQFYKSPEWKSVRDLVIFRDNGCDLGMDGYEIKGRIYIHHMNPMSVSDIQQNSDFLLNPEYLIVVSHNTHNAIHFGDENLFSRAPVERKKNDTCPWKQNGKEKAWEKVY